MPKKFITQHGLKVMLDLSYFMQFITGEKKQYSSAEILGNPIMDNIISMIEQRFQYPAILKWYATLILMIFFSHIDIIYYTIILAAAALIGIIWRITMPDTLIDRLLNLIFDIMGLVYTLFSKIWFIPYLIVIIIGLIRNKVLLIAFFVISLFMCIISILINKIILNKTAKKYEFQFNDTELCAFITFYVMFEKTDGLSNFIQDYCLYIKNEQLKYNDNDFNKQLSIY